MDTLPLVDLLPLQPPLAVQEVALLEDQLSVLDWPELIDVGDALNETVGAGEVVPDVDPDVEPAPEDVGVLGVDPVDPFVVVPGLGCELLVALPDCVLPDGAVP